MKLALVPHILLSLFTFNLSTGSSLSNPLPSISPTPRLLTTYVAAVSESGEPIECPSPDISEIEENNARGSSFALPVISIAVGTAAYFCCFPDRLFLRRFRNLIHAPNIYNSSGNPPRNFSGGPSNQQVNLDLDVTVETPESSDSRAEQTASGEVAYRRVRMEDVCQGLAPDDCTCCICLDSLASERQIVALPCDHVLHEDCALSWRARSTLCPVCRTAAGS